MRTLSSPATDACSFPQESIISTETPSSPVSELTTYPRTPPSPSEAAFICTICWQHQPLGSKPKLLGTSARIVCRACWRAILDLSICWVCGECIVRGDEVVSLGWCFWHSGCFGCLVCRTRMDVPGLQSGKVSDHGITRQVRGVGEWGKWDGSDDDGIGKRRGIGIELDTIPLCNACSVETASENQKQVLERGLECVSLFDGGLSRDRLEMLTKAGQDDTTPFGRHLNRTPRRLRGATGIEQELKRYINGSSVRATNDLLNPEDLSPLFDNAADMGEIADCSTSSMDNEQQHSTGTETISNQPHGTQQLVAYISVIDPVGEPAFKPGKFKPLPSWMNLLSTNVRKEREQRRNANLEHDNQQFSRLDSPKRARELDSRDASDDVQGSPIALVNIPGLRSGGKAAKKKGHRMISVDVLHDTDKKHNIDDNLQSPEKLHTFKDNSQNPSFHPLLPRRRTPYPQDFLSLSNVRKNGTGYSPPSLNSNIAEEPTVEPCCGLGSDLHQPESAPETSLSPNMRRKQIPSNGVPQSSLQYMDTHALKSPAAKNEPVVDNSERERTERPRVVKGTKNKRTSKRRKGKSSKRLASDE